MSAPVVVAAPLNTANIHMLLPHYTFHNLFRLMPSKKNRENKVTGALAVICNKHQETSV